MEDSREDLFGEHSYAKVYNGYIDRIIIYIVCICRHGRMTGDHMVVNLQWT